MTFRYSTQRLIKHGVAVAIMLVGAFLVFTVVMRMNQPPAKKKRVKRSAITLMKVKKHKKTKTRKIVRKRPRPKAVQRRAHRAPPPLVGSNLAGIDVGLPATDPSGFGNLGNSLIDSTKALGDVIMDESSVDVPPVPIAQTSPEFPARARAEGLNGYVKIQMIVEANGAVTHVQVLDSSHTVFVNNAVNAVRQWRFRPAQYNGKAVKQRKTITVRFKLT